MPLTYQNKKYYTPAEFSQLYAKTIQTIYAYMKDGMMNDGTPLETIKLLDKTFVRVK
jgi:hypothetical protein